jgi:hypothetical protein
LRSDAATMQIIRWTKGGFGMAAHNYDGDMLTDEVAQVRRNDRSTCTRTVSTPLHPSPA